MHSANFPYLLVPALRVTRGQPDTVSAVTGGSGQFTAGPQGDKHQDVHTYGLFGVSNRCVCLEWEEGGEPEENSPLKGARPGIEPMTSLL